MKTTTYKRIDNGISAFLATSIAGVGVGAIYMAGATGGVADVARARGEEIFDFADKAILNTEPMQNETIADLSSKIAEMPVLFSSNREIVNGIVDRLDTTSVLYDATNVEQQGYVREMVMQDSQNLRNISRSDLADGATMAVLSSLLGAALFMAGAYYAAKNIYRMIVPEKKKEEEDFSC